MDGSTEAGRAYVKAHVAGARATRKQSKWKKSKGKKPNRSPDPIDPLLLQLKTYQGGGSVSRHKEDELEDGRDVLRYLSVATESAAQELRLSRGEIAAYNIAGVFCPCKSEPILVCCSVPLCGPLVLLTCGFFGKPTCFMEEAPCFPG